jgi:hypothetical protein
MLPEAFVFIQLAHLQRQRRMLRPNSGHGHEGAPDRTFQYRSDSVRLQRHLPRPKQPVSMCSCDPKPSFSRSLAFLASAKFENPLWPHEGHHTESIFNRVAVPQPHFPWRRPPHAIELTGFRQSPAGRQFAYPMITHRPPTERNVRSLRPPLSAGLSYTFGRFPCFLVRAS